MTYKHKKKNIWLREAYSLSQQKLWEVYWGLKRKVSNTLTMLELIAFLLKINTHIYIYILKNNQGLEEFHMGKANEKMRI